MHRIQNFLSVNTGPHQCCSLFPTLPVRKPNRTAVSQSMYVPTITTKFITNTVQEGKGKTVPIDAMKVGGVEVQRHSCLTSAVDAGEWSTSRTGRFNPGR
jgi:hypothetical protein